jgi:hypothetical protein
VRASPTATLLLCCPDRRSRRDGTAAHDHGANIPEAQQHFMTRMSGLRQRIHIDLAIDIARSAEAFSIECG